MGIHVTVAKDMFSLSSIWICLCMHTHTHTHTHTQYQASTWSARQEHSNTCQGSGPRVRINLFVSWCPHVPWPFQCYPRLPQRGTCTHTHTHTHTSWVSQAELNYVGCLQQNYQGHIYVTNRLLTWPVYKPAARLWAGQPTCKQYWAGQLIIRSMGL